MWYFVWFLGVLLACAFGIINGLWFDQVEDQEAKDKEAKEKELLNSGQKEGQ
ncbi:cyd operon protein YbgT [Psychromonas sp. CNPT3]|uniref:cytochrome bd-I oxidase subunit CydX n=1 Tax=Psychromonas sp. CNPT3 TaxID=314282 RepID=UPI00006E4854|nr:cytochrome bd-I oxidase subunit CydX [Psychromonas sp. CNPT3]AGH81816.1 cyd operon protein YbgT [Psychromonas sp. CNPT3]